MAEEKERKSHALPDAATKRESGTSPEELNQPDEWLKNAVERIESKGADDLEVQPTINKLEYQTTISRSEYQTAPFPTDKIMTRSAAAKSPANSANPPADTSVSSIPLQFAYSLLGLLFGIVLALVGLTFLIRGVAGSSSWTAALLGLKADQISDAIPGMVLIALGIFLIFITRFQKH